MKTRKPRAHASPSLSPDDLDRLQYATGKRAVDLGASLFGPRSVTWRVNREAIVLLGGGRALLLQVAHPLVAAGVAAHSNFRRDPLPRLWRTLDLVLTVTFASAAEAIGAVRAIERRHASVRGHLPAAEGRYEKGTAYDANDPALQFWVHATLVETALLVYERFVRPLSARDRRQYYEESKIVARLFGIPVRMIPTTLAEFEAYADDMISGPELAVGPTSRDIAESLLWPPLAPGLRETVAAVNTLSAGLLPPLIRDRYGISWGRGRALTMEALTRTARLTLPFLPDLVRAMPHARRAGRVVRDQ